MKVIIDFTTKILIKNKKRTIATILGVILSTILLMTVGFSFSTSRENAIEQTILNNGDHHIKVENLTYDKIDILQKNNEIKEIKSEPIVETIDFRSIVRSSYVNQNYELEIHGIDPTSTIELDRGTLPQNAQELLLPNYLKSMINIEIGDLIGTYKVVGFYKRASNIAYKTNDYANPFIGYTKKEKEQTDKAIFWITFKDINNITDKVITIGKSLNLKREFQVIGKHLKPSYEGITQNTSLLALYGTQENDATYAMYFIMMLLLLTILSIVCILLIYNAFAISVQERKKIMGILSSLGATPKQLFLSVIFEAFLITIIAFPIGIICGGLIVNGVLAFINETLKETLATPYKFAVYPLFMLVPFLALCLTIFFSAFSPAMRAFEITPMDAIRGNKDIKLNKKKLKTHSIMMRLFGIEGTIAFKNQKRNKSKYRITLISIITGIVFFMTTSTIINLILDSYRIQQLEDNSISISVHGTDEQKFIEDLVTNFSGDDFTILKKSPFLAIPILDTETKEFRKLFSEIGYRSAYLVKLTKEEENEFFKTNKLEKKITIINQIETSNEPVQLYSNLETLPICLRTTDFKISDQCIHIEDFNITDNIPKSLQSFYAVAIIVPMKEWEQTLNRFTLEDSENYQISIANVNPSKLNTYITNEKDNYNFDYFYYNNAPYNYHLKVKEIRAYQILFYGALGLIFLISLTSMFQTIATSIHLRMKEFGVLKSIGMTPKQFKKMMNLESIFLGIKSLLYGIPLSLGVIYLFDKIFGLQSIDNPGEVYHIPFPTIYLIFCISFVLLLLLMVTYYATKQIRKATIMDALEKE